MLEYSKIILEKVSFDPSLFGKELKKHKRWLLKKERKELEEWCKNNFAAILPKKVSKV